MGYSAIVLIASLKFYNYPKKIPTFFGRISKKLIITLNKKKFVPNFRPMLNFFFFNFFDTNLSHRLYKPYYGDIFNFKIEWFNFKILIQSVCRLKIKTSGGSASEEWYFRKYKLGIKETLQPLHTGDKIGGPQCDL